MSSANSPGLENLPAIFVRDWGNTGLASCLVLEKTVCLSKGQLCMECPAYVIVTFFNFLFLLPLFSMGVQATRQGFFGCDNYWAIRPKFVSHFLAQPVTGSTYPKPLFFIVLRKELSGTVNSCFQWPGQVETGTEPRLLSCIHWDGGSLANPTGTHQCTLSWSMLSWLQIRVAPMPIHCVRWSKKPMIHLTKSWHRISLSQSRWPWTSRPPASVTGQLGWQVCTTRSRSPFLFLCVLQKFMSSCGEGSL